MEGLCNPHLVDDLWQQVKNKKQESSRLSSNTHRKLEKASPRLDCSDGSLSGFDRVGYNNTARMTLQPQGAGNSVFNEDFDNFMDGHDVSNPAEEYMQWMTDVALRVEMGLPIPDSPPPSKAVLRSRCGFSNPTTPRWEATKFDSFSN